MTEHRDLTDRVTFTAFVQRARPRGTGGLREIRYAAVNTWADGLIERATNYADIDEVRAAAERLAGERG